MNAIGIGNYGLINSNYAKKTSTDHEGYRSVQSLHKEAYCRLQEG